MAENSPSGIRLALVGPLPPPINGQSVVMSHMLVELGRHFEEMRVVDTSEGSARGWGKPIVKLAKSAAALWQICGSDAVYIAVKAGRGMWLTSVAAGTARLTGSRVFLHHHSYAYVHRRQGRMTALTRAAGRSAHHIVLSRSMEGDLRRVMPEVRRSLVLGNAGLVDQSLLELPLKSDAPRLVLGHLSNLSLAKGIAEVVDLAVALYRSGVDIRLVVAGPALDPASRSQLDRAARELGQLFEYRGPLAGSEKHAFYEEITHFVFPSRYLHEAAPLVLYEAMAAGVVCVATRQGSIAELLEGSPAVLAQNADSFVGEVLPALTHTPPTAAASALSRQRYLRGLSESNDQLSRLIELLLKSG